MSAKLIVHKFESGINIKSLHITIKDDNNDSTETKYSEWLDDTYQQKKKDHNTTKSRLIVKIVSKNELDYFNLDKCAKEVSNLEIHLNDVSHIMSSDDYKQVNNAETTFTKTNLYESLENSNEFNCYNQFVQEDRTTKAITLSSNPKNLYHHEATEDDKTDNIVQKMHVFKNGICNVNCSNYLDTSPSPLEYSLEKVKENNARIMENIQMLNRTLNYTKKQEILEIVCPKSVRSYPCNTCGKCFVYETGLRRHYSLRHSMTEIQPRWQVVWTCIECFQVWPRQDLAMTHSSQCCKLDNIDCVREIKTSSLLQCEFCEKVFTSIPRLLRHSKIHTTAKNYECNSCEMAFSSYKAAEQHWLLCPWLKMCYSFSLPKLLLCNACDRKFRNYEQLYNHRYKVGHFMTKTHCNRSCAKSLGILVYQCEICGQWFPSIVPLQSHKSQCHPRYDIAMQLDMNYKESHNNYDISNENDHHLNQIQDMNCHQFVEQ